MLSQVDVSKKINKCLKIYKAQHELPTIEDAINKILEEKFKEKK